MHLRSDLPFWTVRNGLIRVYPPLDTDIRCDALIVGGGISGALLAHRLAGKGVDCVVIDRHDIGNGSTSASTALLQYEIDTPLHKLRAKVGNQAADRAYLLGIEAIHRLQKAAGKDCGFAMRPSLQIATVKEDVKALQRECEMRRSVKLPVAFLDQRDLKSAGFRGAAAIRSTVAGEVDPYQLTHRLMRLALAKGVRVFDRTTAMRYSPSQRGVVVKTDRGVTIRAKAVFFATGYETSTILPKNIVSFKSTYAFVSEPSDIDWWKDRAIIWGTGNPYMYLRTTHDGRILVGGEDDGVLDPDRRDRQLGAKTTRLVRRFHSIFPKQEIEPAFAWAGLFGSTKDGLAYIGKHECFPNAYFGLGFGGNGITFSEIASRILTDQFLGRKNPDTDVFRFER